MGKDIICPACSKLIPYYSVQRSYACLACGFDSRRDAIDISYTDDDSSVLSNLFPHEFLIEGIKCMSMESFIQSLKIEKPFVQKEFCQKYNGIMAYKLNLVQNDWKKTGIVYWQGNKISRTSKEYEALITRAYDALFNNIVFNYFLRSFNGKYLIHTMGCDNPGETLLTEREYRSQLKRLQEKIK